MNRRRIPVLMSTVLILVALAGCSSKAKTGEESKATPTPGLKTLLAGTFTIGTDMPYAPFESLNAKGDTVGFDIELFDEIAGRLGYKTKYNNAVFDTIFTALGTKWDIVVSAVTGYAPAGSPAAETVAGRAKIVIFSKPYYPSLQSLAVNTSKTPNIKSIDDLKSGDRVAVQTGTTGAFWAQVNLQPKGIDTVSFAKAPDMFLALEAGRVKGIINDLPVSQDAVKGKADLAVVQQIETGEEYAFAFAKENPALRDAINVQLTALFDDGTYARLYKKYFAGQQLPSYAKEATPSSSPS